MLSVVSILVSAWVGGSPARTPLKICPVIRCRSPFAAAAAKGIDIQLLQFFPTVPPLVPGAESSPLLCVEGASFSAPVWVSTLQKLAILDADGRQWLVADDGSGTDEFIPSGVWAHAMHIGPGGTSSKLAAGGYGGQMLAVSVEADEAGSAAELPVLAENLGSSVVLLTSLSNGRLLAGLEDGRLLCLSTTEPPATLLTGVGLAAGGGSTLRGACTSDDDRSLYLCLDGGVSLCAVDFDAGECSAPENLALELSSAALGVAIDTADELFVCTAEGLTVFNEAGEAVARVSTPAPVLGCCFGGIASSNLYLAAGDTVWRLKTNAQGVRPRSAAFMKKMDKLAAVGEYVHEGW
jgi:hypothetical protein|eukprot:jgi/Chrpa1/4933/Chrysochromulina_OHIO_Genome00015644-RA